MNSALFHFAYFYISLKANNPNQKFENFDVDGNTT
jgi:hypothetical protein